MVPEKRFYKMRLVNRQRTLFNEYSYSDQWHLLAKAMDDDVRESSAHVIQRVFLF